MDNAIDMFRDALQEADNAPEVVCLLAQVLWAKGGDEERTCWSGVTIGSDCATR